MLILTRKSGERIAIGDDIVLKILEIHGKQVKIGIEAPKHMAVHRGEVFERIQEANLKAASPDPSVFGKLPEALKKRTHITDKDT